MPVTAESYRNLCGFVGDLIRLSFAVLAGM